MPAFHRGNDPAQFGGTPERRYYTGRNLSKVRSIGDLRARTHKLMPRFVLEYLEGGSGEEATLAREREAFAQWRFMPHTLVDESDRSVEVDILGKQAAMPLAIAPTGLNGIFMRGADMALAKAAARANVPFTQSTMSNDPMEEVARVPGLRHWWQLYLFGPDEIWQDIVDRADRAGCEALILTTNAQIFGQRDWDERDRLPSGFPTPLNILNSARHARWLATTLGKGMPKFGTVDRYVPKDRKSLFDKATWIRERMPRSLSWNDVAKIRQRWKKPFFLKGICNPEDVTHALDSGVDGRRARPVPSTQANGAANRRAPPFKASKSPCSHYTSLIIFERRMPWPTGSEISWNRAVILPLRS